MDSTKLLAAMLVSYGLAAVSNEMHPVVPHQLLLTFLARIPDDLARLRCHPLLFLARLAREVDRYTLTRAVEWLYARLEALQTLDDLVALVQEHIVPSVALEPGALGFPTAHSREAGTGRGEASGPRTVYSTYMAGTSLSNYGPDHLLWRPVEYAIPSLLHLPPAQVSADSACGRLVRLVLMDSLSTFSDLVRVYHAALSEALPALHALAEALRSEASTPTPPVAQEVEAYIAASSAYAKFQNKEWHTADRTARGIPHPNTSRRGVTTAPSRRRSIVRVPSSSQARSSSSSRSASLSRGDEGSLDRSASGGPGFDDHTPDTSRLGGLGSRATPSTSMMLESPPPLVQARVAAGQGVGGGAGARGGGVGLGSDPFLSHLPGTTSSGVSSGSGSSASTALIPRPFGPLGPYRRALWRVAGETSYAKALLALAPASSTHASGRRIVELPVGWATYRHRSQAVSSAAEADPLSTAAGVLTRVVVGATLLSDKPPYTATGGWSLLDALRVQEEAGALAGSAAAAVLLPLPGGTSLSARVVAAAADAGLCTPDLFDPLLAVAISNLLGALNGYSPADWAGLENAVGTALAASPSASRPGGQQLTSGGLDWGVLTSLYAAAWAAQPSTGVERSSVPPPAFLTSSSSVDYLSAVDGVRRARDLSYGMTLLRGKPVVGSEAQTGATTAATATPLGAITDASAALRLLSLFGRGHELLVSAASAPAVSGTALGRPLLHYGLLQLGIVEAAAGHILAAVEALREGVRIAQSHGDAACVSLAQELLVDLEDSLNATCNPSGTVTLASRRTKVLGALHAYQRACCQSLWRQQTTAALRAVEEAVLLLAGGESAASTPSPCLIPVPVRDWLSLDPAVSYRAGGHGVGAGVQGIHLADADAVLQGDWDPRATRVPLLHKEGKGSQTETKAQNTGSKPAVNGATDDAVLPFALEPLANGSSAALPFSEESATTTAPPTLSRGAMYPGSAPALAVAAGAVGGTGIPSTPLLYTSGTTTSSNGPVGVHGLSVTPLPTPLALTALASPTQAVLANAERRAQLLEVITNSVWGRTGSGGGNSSLAPPVPMAGSASIWSAPSPLSLQEAAALTARGHLSRAKQWEALGYPALAKAASLCAAAAAAPPVQLAVPSPLHSASEVNGDPAGMEALARLLHTAPGL